MHKLANDVQLGGTVNIQRKTGIAWIYMKTEIIMLNTRNKGERRGQTWSVDLEV